MTKLELIRLIGDVLTEIDMQIGDLLPNDPKQRELQDLRLLLDDRQRRLAGQAFNDNTTAFQRAAEELQSINGDIKQTIADVARIQDTINNVTRFLNSLTTLATVVGAVV
jgi:hypothetical protein